MPGYSCFAGVICLHGRRDIHPSGERYATYGGVICRIRDVIFVGADGADGIVSAVKCCPRQRDIFVGADLYPPFTFADAMLKE